MAQSDTESFAAFMREREAAATAYVSGNAAPLRAVTTSTSPATFFGPQGGYREGADDVWATYQRDVGAFAAGSENHFEILHMAAGDGLGYWVGFQRAQAQMQGQAEPIPFNLRVTELYRREDGEWKLIHRHADALAEPT